ncbi:MAG: type VI secretion system-associated FHA domain protein TagH [Woeseiaceae bacterium]|nr:type VI secretion system-associated FHA domain protein TagH [Woeseiaceae bacterium]
MPLQLEIVSEHRELVGDDAVRVFEEMGGTIGRSLHNDWILPDPDRYISGKHAAVDCRGGIYYLTDLSSNGVYVNHENAPVGRGNTRRLFNGDTLHLGDFKIKVTVEGGEDLDIPDEPKRTLHHDNMERLTSMISPLTDVEMLDEEEITGDEEFEAALFGKSKRSVAVPSPVPGTGDEHKINDVGIEQVGVNDLLDAFLEGLGVKRDDLHPSVDVKQVMKNAGEVLREYVKGSEKLLVNRANLKAAFKLDQTMVLPRHNNPLKLSQNTEDSIKQLLVGQDGGEYLGPKDAVRETNKDLLLHQEAFLEAMTAAFADFADRFDPEELIESFDRTLNRKPRFKMLSEQKYWQLYKELYPIMIERGGGRFPQMLAEDFVRAYERQVADANRPEFDKTADYGPKNAEKAAISSNDEIDPEISAELESLPDPEEQRSA